MDEQELEKVRHRTRRGQREAVLLDFNPGGRAYGYSSELVQTDGKRRWRAVVVPGQADVVRQIFEKYGAGVGLKAIAESLNDQGIPSPGSTWNRKSRRCKGWLHSAVRAILKNERYVGKLIWNRTQWISVPFSSRRKKVDRPRQEWVIREIPALRIVSDELWNQVQARFDAPSRRALAKSQKARMGRPPKHLLSGVMVCVCCGANMVIESRGRYACSSRTNGAKSLCDNALRVDASVAETALLSGIRDRLLDEAMLRRVRKTVRDQLKAARKPATDVEKLRGSLRDVENRLERIADAIAEAGLSPTLRKRLATLESEQGALEARITQAGQEAPARFPEMVPAVVDAYRELVEGIATLGADPETTPDEMRRARDMLSALFGRIRVEPRGDALVAKVSVTGARLAAASPASISPTFVVAGVRSQRYLALVTALDILASRPHSRTVKVPPCAP